MTPMNLNLSCPVCPKEFAVETPQRARRAITQHLTRAHAVPSARKKSRMADIAVRVWEEVNNGHDEGTK